MYFLCIILGKNKHIYEYILKEENGKLCYFSGQLLQIANQFVFSKQREDLSTQHVPPLFPLSVVLLSHSTSSESQNHAK